MTSDRRLIEDLIPLAPINGTSVHDKLMRVRHPALLHLWWARRPLPAARAAIYATLVPVDGTDPALRSAEFFASLCRWGTSAEVLDQARQAIQASAGKEPPKVLDMFAGGGAIPLEAARLGCHATAVELNPVAHLIELCMLDYPRRFGPGLADEIELWGHRWVDEAWGRVGHLYPGVSEPDSSSGHQLDLAGDTGARDGRRPLAYLWTRTVPCPNPSREEHEVPLVRQTWLSRKKGHVVALRPEVNEGLGTLRWELAEASSASELDFDPGAFSAGGKATCFLCGTSVDAEYVKAEGRAGRLGVTALAAVLPHPSGRGREYLPAGSYPLPDDADAQAVLDELSVDPPSEALPKITRMTGGMCTLYGLVRYEQLFTRRQLATLCALAGGIREQHEAMVSEGMEPDRARAVCALLGLTLDRTVDRGSTLCRWDSRSGGRMTNTYARQALPMVWDFVETNPFAGAGGDVRGNVTACADIIRDLAEVPGHVAVHRTSATQLPDADGTFDAVITDPPYYDNISYADLSDFFYVWLKRSVGFLYPEHFSGVATPTRREIVAVKYRHGGDQGAASRFYEDEMEAAFREAHRVLKPDAPLVCVYAHKTTLGWAALVEALRRSGFTITEAWPLDTEMPERSIGRGKAALASSIFLVARRRAGEGVGAYNEVVENLDEIIAERLERLSEAGVSGSDLVIAAIGAGLQAFTRYSSVELPNGEEVPAESFLEKVQSKVLNAVLGQVHGLSNGVGAIDPATRYYVIARFSFGYADIDFDEANNLARSAGVELDELADGGTPLAKVSKGKVHFHDYSERGEEPTLGLDGEGSSPPLIDVLHGLLWRASHHRDDLRNFMVQADFEPAKLRLVAQALQGRALRAEGENKPAEAQACERLLGAWKTLVDDNLLQQ